MLTRDDLIAIFPRPKGGSAQDAWDGYVEALTSQEGADLLRSYDVTTPLRVSHLLATFGAETNLSLVWESGAYSADGIVRVFGPGKHSAKIGPAEARTIASLPLDQRTKVLFERVYGTGNPKKARELGNTQIGDGWRFRGLGLVQLTGRTAHETAAANIGCTIDDLAYPLHCLHAALLEWDEKDCNRFADEDDAVSIRKLINGGNLKVSVARINGLPEALAAVRRAKRVITPADSEAQPETNVAASKTPPASMAHSTEGQAAGATGFGGGLTLYNGTQKAAMNTASKGEFTLKAFLLALIAEPEFWAGLTIVGGSAYWFFKRRARL